MKIASLDLINSTYLELEPMKEVVIDSAHSFDSYHNSFFITYWSQHTSLQSASLKLSAKGEGVLRLVCNENGNVTTLKEVQVNSNSYENIDIRFNITNSEASRIYLKAIPELSENITIENNASWNTDQAPEKDIKLAVIMCTFNKQEYIHKNIELLINNEAFQNSDIEFFIIDNASNLNLEETDKFYYFKQGNFGGAGGFTRGLIEARAMNKFTHYQFMDDDILLDPDMILRAKSFLSFQKEDVAFSGAMLCMNDKNRIWEAGANYPHPSKNLTPSPCMFNSILNKDLLTKISRPYEFDYGGWWFFTFSEKMVKKVGLPYPFFIRGDDVEYSLRLKKNKFKIVNLPGVCVWHETFFGKTAYWLQYYNLRNYIAFSIIYFSWSKTYKMTFSLMKMVFSDLLFYQYQKVSILNKAIFDLQTYFFRFHKKSTPQHHKALTESISHIKDKTSKGVLKETVSPGNSLWVALKVLTLNYHLVPTSKSRAIIIDSEAWKPKLLKSSVSPMVNEIIISNKKNGKCFSYKKKLSKFLTLTMVTLLNLPMFFILLPIYKLITPLVFKKYKLTSFWRSFLSIN